MAGAIAIMAAGAILFLASLILALAELAQDPGRHAGAISRRRPADAPRHTAAAVRARATAPPRGWAHA